MLQEKDKAVWDIIKKEEDRQEYGIELIASENFVSKAVMEAAGSVLTNKYAEGYSGKRYYGGCQFVDEVETLAIERVKKYLELLMQMFKLIQVLKLIWLFIWLLLIRGIQFLE